MTLKTGVTDDQLGQFYRRVGAIATMLGKSRPFDVVMSELQQMHDGELTIGSTRFGCTVHGHLTISITGLRETASQALGRLRAMQVGVDRWTGSRLVSAGERSYDRFHRLEEGKDYRVALVPTEELGDDCTIGTGTSYGKSLGYQRPVAGIAPYILEVVPAETLRRVGFEFVIVPHDLLKDSIGTRSMLVISTNTLSGTPTLRAENVDEYWPSLYKKARGAFAFFVHDR